MLAELGVLVQFILQLKSVRRIGANIPEHCPSSDTKRTLRHPNLQLPSPESSGVPPVRYDQDQAKLKWGFFRAGHLQEGPVLHSTHAASEAGVCCSTTGTLASSEFWHLCQGC